MMKEFKIRCSAIGQIMTNARAKNEILGQTAKTYAENWVKEQLYGKRREISSKYMLKGTQMEDEAIDLLSVYDFASYTKNQQSFENDFMTGTPDIISPAGVVIDIKTSWDCFTFPLFDAEIPTKDYYYQLQGYMALTGLKAACLAYCLVDTPVHIIESESKRLVYNEGYDFDEAVEILTEKMRYTGIDLKLRVKTFNVEYDQTTIDAIYQRVQEVREYINTLKR